MLLRSWRLFTVHVLATPRNSYMGTRTRVSQVCRRLVVLFRGYRIFRNTPAMSEAVGQFEDGQDELSFGSATLLESSLESKLFDFGGV